MRLFGSDETALALTVGELKAKVEELTRRLDALDSVLDARAHAPESATVQVERVDISPRIMATVRGLAGSDQALYRHLLGEAAGMLSLGGGDDETAVIAALVNGSRPVRH